ncbi:hypothetical protein [Afipia sp. DC4300-2b1]|uniref:hypothetical protein n=1 Tax=Afipia sp. DC4300-2b1 TaxID=2804672 RepID=UPI003CF7EBDC
MTDKTFYAENTRFKFFRADTDGRLNPAVPDQPIQFVIHAPEGKIFASGYLPPKKM